MLLKVVAVRDNAVEAYLQPQYVTHVGGSVRAFTDGINDSKSDWNSHPEDYDLFLLAEYDDMTGIFTPPSQGIERLARGADVFIKS